MVTVLVLHRIEMITEIFFGIDIGLTQPKTKCGGDLSSRVMRLTILNP